MRQAYHLLCYKSSIEELAGPAIPKNIFTEYILLFSLQQHTAAVFLQYVRDTLTNTRLNLVHNLKSPPSDITRAINLSDKQKYNQMSGVLNATILNSIS